LRSHAARSKRSRLLESSGSRPAPLRIAIRRWRPQRSASRCSRSRFPASRATRSTRRELAPGASGYTYDTLRAIRDDLGANVPLVMLIGSDQYEKLGAWHRSSELFSLCRFAVFGRPAPPHPAGPGRGLA
jgi:nicotinate-nucleotide adenylyltransferase